MNEKRNESKKRALISNWKILGNYSKKLCSNSGELQLKRLRKIFFANFFFVVRQSATRKSAEKCKKVQRKNFLSGFSTIFAEFLAIRKDSKASPWRRRVETLRKLPRKFVFSQTYRLISIFFCHLLELSGNANTFRHATVQFADVPESSLWAMEWIASASVSFRERWVIVKRSAEFLRCILRQSKRVIVGKSEEISPKIDKKFKNLEKNRKNIL